MSLCTFGRVLKIPYFKSAGFKLFCLSLVSLLAALQCSGQVTDYKVHANIIYRFTKYLQWPENRPSGDFVIGIVGDSPLYEELGALTVNRFVGNLRIVVKKLSASAASYSCQILFISQDESRSLKRIALLTANQPMLLITEENGLAKKGSCINFIIVDDRLKLEINKNNVLSRNLNIASDLLKLATIITTDNVIANTPKP
ncbi:MAG: YfiR family protein [Bacteroidota bacterium]|nr:YfiR family protein [Bacteroidota bacterium]